MTDPDNPDTDEDGLSDGQDPLPLVPMCPEPTPESEMMLFVMEFIYGTGKFLSGVEATHSVPDRKKPGNERVRFVAGNRSNFLGLTASKRTVVLSSDELGESEAKFGGTIAASQVVVFMLNPQKNRGYVIWDSRYWGGSSN